MIASLFVAGASFAQKPATKPAPAPALASPADALSKGDSAYVARDLDGALAAYREGLGSDPKNAALHYRVGQVHVAKGELKEAETAYLESLRNATNDGPLRAKLLFVIADLRERQKDHDAATGAWTKYEGLAKRAPNGTLPPQTAQERKKRISDYKKLVADYAAVRARIEKRMEEADQRARKSAQ